MLPGFVAQGVLTYFFRPETTSSLLTGLPIFILLSIGNLIAYHLFLIPKKIKSELSTLLFGKKYNNPFEAYEDILTEIIEGAKARQAAYDGYKKSDLIALFKTANIAERKYTALQKVGEYVFYIYLAGVLLLNVFLSGFPLDVLYVEWGIALIILISNHIIAKRRYHWSKDAITLKRCLEKCEDKEVFQFDNKL
jgi:hypothetical protein